MAFFRLIRNSRMPGRLQPITTSERFAVPLFWADLALTPDRLPMLADMAVFRAAPNF